MFSKRCNKKTRSPTSSADLKLSPFLFDVDRPCKTRDMIFGRRCISFDIFVIFFVTLQNRKKWLNQLILFYVMNIPERSDVDPGRHHNHRTGCQSQELAARSVSLGSFIYLDYISIDYSPGIQSTGVALCVILRVAADKVKNAYTYIYTYICS